MYKMKDEFKTGIDFIDAQHKKLFDIADDAYNLLKNEFTIDKYDKVVQLINELKEYTAFHFKCEEEYMESINYKRMFTQKIEHDAFIKKLDDIDFKTIDENPDKYVFEMLEFLNNWLTGHILHNDKLIGEKK
ncbi:bacteriohemerythrin [Clostridium saccharobutylicum]|uniref:Bacteriohemerythrin n=2 Tax=Clostridium saccharobutylicum TaxID=169679 RepID=U5MPT8_CLOSA|nr:hemerythrin family protein [Clostridium saccharobutylicum]AGX42523.1 bacteriohemerythrin [Clostridium saccharobutylicum DSM 13864]AQR89809.1 bacteriohemerythrin [Clostridium saccharobutylicum]AQR99711.1 bacteriohemerythrin [Clostridium saccharobutylicum]AQS09441.1 bacteriohemerythrin [Clostridium saccharobutylicum]AQS13697.1 bacteriohemerythrin [Clostridium saccharobutylicum]